MKPNAASGPTFMGVAKRSLRFVRRYPLASIEILFAAHLIWQIATNPDVRLVLGLFAVNALGLLRSTWALLQVDTLGTLESMGLTATKLLVVALPFLVLAWRWRGWERLQLLPLVLIFQLLPLAGSVSLLTLALMSALAIWLSRYRWLGWTVVMPLALLLAPVPIHHFAFVWNHDALVERCRSNSGRRPVNLQPDQITPHYTGASVLRPGEVLLPGAGAASWWLRKTGTDWEIDAPSKVNFSFWPGCVIGDALWLARPNFAMSVRRDPDTGVESIRKIPIPKESMDYGWIVCLPEENRILITEALNGNGIWEVNPDAGTARRFAGEVGGLGVLARRGKPGQLIAANGSDLMLYSIEKEEIVEQTAAGVQMFNGLDVCPHDWETSLADVTGRVRFFKPDAEGHYQFTWGISLQAPRSVVYSPDCEHLAVASWDDETVWLVNRNERRVVETYHVGPNLRAVTFLGPREFAVVDVCTMTTIVF